jgi:hypothetical protein
MPDYAPGPKDKNGKPKGMGPPPECPPNLAQQFYQTDFPVKPTGHEDDWKTELDAWRQRPGVIRPEGMPDAPYENPGPETPADWEASLLGAAMGSDKAVDSLWALDKISPVVARDNAKAIVMGQEEKPLPTRKEIADDVALEFTDGRRGELAKTIMELHTRGLPHDADACIDTLRDRNRLPTEWDPDVPLVPIDRDQYGIANWQNNTVLHADTAQMAASKVRENYLPQYLLQVGEQTTALARGAIEDPAAFGEAKAKVTELIKNTPPRLDSTAKPAAHLSTGNVDTSWSGFSEQGPNLTLGTDLGLPVKPVLSEAAQKILAHTR